MPNGNSHPRITINFPSTQILNSDSETVRVADGLVTYSVYLNPGGITHIEIEGLTTPFTGGVVINEPVLTVDSTRLLIHPVLRPLLFRLLQPALTRSTRRI